MNILPPKVSVFLFSTIIILASLTKKTDAKVFMVSTSAQLRTAFNTVEPGDNIVLAPGVYNSTGGKVFEITRSGNSTHRIFMNSMGENGQAAILTSGTVLNGRALFLNGASFWTISRNFIKLFTVRVQTHYYNKNCAIN
jgi:cystathionine beta-lyase/cystathionine gamma-synthase